MVVSCAQMARVRHRFVRTVLLAMAHLPTAVALARDITREVPGITSAAETARLALLDDKTLHTQWAAIDVFSLQRRNALGDVVVQRVAVEVRFVIFGEIQRVFRRGTSCGGRQLDLYRGRAAGKLGLPIHSHGHTGEFVTVAFTERLELTRRHSVYIRIHQS